MHHDVYVSDINEEGETEYWKLNKALYGLKQAGHEWYKMLERILEVAGLKQCVGDEGAYTNPTETTMVGTHVDDLIGIAPPGSSLDTMKESIETSVELEKKGEPTKMLGMELTWNKKRNEIILTQKNLIETMMKTHLPIEDHGKTGKKTSLPLDPELF